MDTARYNLPYTFDKRRSCGPNARDRLETTHDMHVLQIPSWYGTPAVPVRGIFFKQQALALADAGHEVGVVYPELRGVHTLHRGRIQYGYQSLSEGPIRTYRYYGFRLPRQPGRFRRRWTELAGRLVRMYVAQHGTPDVLHAHSAIFAGEVATELSAELGVPWVLMEHSSAYLRGRLTSLQTSSTQRAIGAAGAVIAVSHRLKAALEQLTNRENIQVVPNVVDTSRFSPPTHARDQNTFRFVCIAMLGPHKNVQLLLRAFDRAFSADESIVLDIVGDGKDRPRLERLARTMQQRHRITFRGSLDTNGVAKTLERSHCCVSSSDVETFGVTLIEALATGIPVIATRSGGPQDIVTPECGHLVPIADEPALADAMRQVYSDRVHWAQRSHRLSDHAHGTYGPEAVVSRLEAVYRLL